jgi:hypothetical protein
MMSCDRCSISRVVRGHSQALIQLATHRLPEYGMQNDSSKCLNSAVAIAYSLLGDEALKFTRHCDVSNVKARYRDENPSKQIARALAYDLLHDEEEAPGRYIYYIMITDGFMSRGASSPGASVYEPGHVFILERSTNPCDNSPYFHVFQSFIKRYNMDDYLSMTREHTMSKSFLRFLANGLVHLFSVPTWDKRCSEFWKAFTMAPGEMYEGCRIQDAMMLCYHKIPLQNCTGAMKETLTKALSEARAGSPDEPFGTLRKEDAVESLMSNRDIAVHFEQMLADIDQMQG